MDQTGQHLIIDAFNCDYEVINDEKKLEEILTQTIHQLNMNILSTYFHKFSPYGVTGVVVISTSHFSIHTWPEHNYAALDLYTCSDENIWKVILEIFNQLGAQYVRTYELIRGHEDTEQVVMKNLKVSDYVEENDSEVLFEVKNDLGNIWDRMHLEKLVKNNHQILFNGSSQFQDILLIQPNDLRLYLNQELQFSSLDEEYYHQALVIPAMENAQNNERVLILGGGDGLALREVFEYPDVKHVDLVDIDPIMIDLATNNLYISAQNKYAIKDSRAQIHVMDAKEYILNESLEPYDVIIVDFPDPDDEITSSLYTVELFQRLSELLAKGGSLVCQSNSPEDTPVVFWSIAKTIEEAGLYTSNYKMVVPSFGLWGFTIAAHQELNPLPELSFETSTLSTEPINMFNFSTKIISQKNKAQVNRENDLVLHKIFKQERDSWFK